MDVCVLGDADHIFATTVQGNKSSGSSGSYM